ncbi:MAG: RuBisCO large subunit C-terminal-like domain-containing protein [Halioglobus sp.]|nr:RuBisCO large subunit C-terminal-like domain-containing protein [Halioglobus sp.]
MSSENLHHTDQDFFLWRDGLAGGEYLHATYLVSTPVDGEQAALGIAREQSICATHINDIDMPADIERFCARVVSVEEVSSPGHDIASLYFLSTPVYGERPGDVELRQFRIVIAYPSLLFGNSTTRLWNSIFGEVHRLGYLSAAALIDLELPPGLAQGFSGPRYGADGIRGRLQVRDRPLFCRSMRPAAGLSTDEMVQLNERVLEGGFDIIKDDELTYDSERSPFEERVRRMVDMKKAVEDRTGEAKLYFANVIDDISTGLTLAEKACELGADGVLLSSAAQGLSFVSEVQKRTDLILLSHNSCGDAITRSQLWGASDAVMAKLQRTAGADLLVSPGPYSTAFQDEAINRAFIDACSDSLGDCAPCLPIIQGGKQPEFLAEYTADIGSVDYMIVAATWLDNHPRGIRAGAEAFRIAWDNLGRNEKRA